MGVLLRKAKNGSRRIVSKYEYIIDIYIYIYISLYIHNYEFNVGSAINYFTVVSKFVC